MKISVITPTFNSAATLRECLDSLLGQTFQDIESWVIDGGSTDGTLDILREYELKFSGRLHWLSEPDRGLYDGMNKGIDRATGDIVGILNSDDYYTSNNILQLIADTFATAEKQGETLDAVYGDVHFIDSRNPQTIVRYYSSAIFRPALLRFGYMPAHPSFYCLRQVYQQYGTYSLDLRLAADFEIMVRFFHKHHIVARYLKRDFVTMRTGGVSTANIRNRLTLTAEDAKSCRMNGMYSNFLFCCVKYFTKVFEFRPWR